MEQLFKEVLISLAVFIASVIGIWAGWIVSENSAAKRRTYKDRVEEPVEHAGWNILVDPGEGGYVLLVVLFAMLVMSIVATATMSVANDQAKASRATRYSAGALNAAEYGLGWARTSYSGWDSLQSGETLDLPRQSLPGGTGEFDVRITRTDNDSTNAFAHTFTISSRGFHASGADRVASLFVTNGTVMSGGLATSSAATTRGTVDVQGGAEVTGFDSNPSEWNSVCGAPDSDRPGLTMNDSLLLDDTGGTTAGLPPVAQVPLNDSILSYFGEIAWDDLLALPHVTVVGAAPRDLVGCTDAVIVAELCGPNEIGPRYNADGTCDKTHEMNWGSNNPANPCFDHFPIIEIQEEVDVNYCPRAGVNGACNGIFVLASDTTGGVRAGAELDVELDVKMRGPIFGRGCVEFQQGADYLGSVFVDGTYNFGECNDDATLDVHDAGTRVGYSSCAIERALLANGLGLPVLAFDRVVPIRIRAFGEPIR